MYKTDIDIEKVNKGLAASKLMQLQLLLAQAQERTKEALELILKGK